MTTINERIMAVKASIGHPFLGDTGSLDPLDVKLGVGMSQLVFSPRANGQGSVSLSIPSSGKPGFRFGSDSGHINTGKSLKLSPRLSSIVWGNGMTLNPLFEILPPNIVNYYPIMVPDLGDIADIASVIGGLL
jgi:hypothetical protein